MCSSDLDALADVRGQGKYSRRQAPALAAPIPLGRLPERGRDLQLNVYGRFGTLAAAMGPLVPLVGLFGVPLLLTRLLFGRGDGRARDRLEHLAMEVVRVAEEAAAGAATSFFATVTMAGRRRRSPII